MKTREYYTLLNKARKNLSLIIIFCQICKAITWVGGFSGLLILLIRWWNRGRELKLDYLGLWLFLTLIVGGVWGLIMASRRRIDDQKTAQWLDGHLFLNETLTAAHLCLNRNCSGPFDLRIMEQAESYAEGINSEGRQSIRWPTKTLNQRIRITCLTVLVFALLVACWNPKTSSSIPLRELTLNMEESESWEEFFHEAEILMDISAKEVAEMLFSFDQELARKAEEALESGDAGLFREVLEYAKKKIGTEMADPETSSDGAGLMQKWEMAGKVAQMLEGKGNKGQQKQSQSAQRKDDSSEEKERPEKEEAGDKMESGVKKEAAGAEGASPLTKQGLEGESSRGESLNVLQTPTPQQSDTPLDGEVRADKRPGAGAGEEEGKWEDLDHGSKAQAIIKQRVDEKVFEYLLPGEDAVLPLVDFIPELQQVSEAAMEKEALPLEYEEFVKNYYLRLYKEVSAKPGK